MNHYFILVHHESLSQPCLEKVFLKENIIKRLAAFSCALHQQNLIKFCKAGY